MADEVVKLRVQRYSPEEGTFWSDYTIPYEESMSVLTALRKVYASQDPSLTIRQCQCLRGLCTVCDVRINGRIQKACSIPVQPGEELTIQPKSEKSVLRDLVCSRE